MVEAEDVRQPKLGKLKPRYRFALNPHADYRASRCPNCDWLTYARKFALLIHVDPNYPLALGFTCCYCPKCELIIAHQDELEAQLTALFQERDPSIIGNDYLVLGTVELKVWKESLSRPKSIAEILEHAADFKEHVTIEYFPGSWYPKDFVPPIPPRHKTRRKKK
jgi:hypothetical protein